MPPPNSYGLLLLLQLKRLAEHDLANYGHDTADYISLLVKINEEARRAA